MALRTSGSVFQMNSAIEAALHGTVRAVFGVMVPSVGNIRIVLHCVNARAGMDDAS